MFSKRGSQARKSQSMKFLHLPLVFSTPLYQLALACRRSSSLALRRTFTSPLVVMVRADAAAQRESDSPRLSCSEDILRDRGRGEGSPVYDFYTQLPFYDIQDHVCLFSVSTVCDLFFNVSDYFSNSIHS